MTHILLCLPTAGCFLFSVGQRSSKQQQCSVFQTNNDRFYCWPWQCPLLPFWEGEAELAFSCSLTQTVWAYLTSCSVANRSKCKIWQHFLLNLFPQFWWHICTVVTSCSCLFAFLSLCSPAAWLGLYLRAGFQRTAVWSSHISWLQDALKTWFGGPWCCSKCNPWPPGGDRHSHVHRETHCVLQNGHCRGETRPKTRQR